MFNSIIIFLFFLSSLFASPTELTPEYAVRRAHEMMEQHPVFKEVSPALVKRILQTYCEEMDAFKIYLLREEVKEWVDPTDHFIKQVITSFETGRFDVFEKMLATTQEAIARNRRLEERLDKEPSSRAAKMNMRKLDWASSEEELVERLGAMRAIQQKAISQLDPAMHATALQRLQKRKAKYEEAREVQDPLSFKQTAATFVMKAFAEALDSESAYFTPAEAKQLLINMQQKLFGIGVVLRDDVDGFTVVKIVEGGPAERQGGLELGDRVIAINGDPVIGYDLVDVVELIRGAPGTNVALRVVRQKDNNNVSRDLLFKRGKVVMRELRYGTQVEPYEDGVTVYLKLHSFYQDDETSSYADLLACVEKIQRNNTIKGVILDLRFNPGGLLSQAVAVSGLFLDKGVVVSIQDGEQRMCHMRNITSRKVWDGPLIVLVNRASASASEIVAQALQDWGRAIVVGDDRSFGKGSFQLFTLSSNDAAIPDPLGEYKVTRGRYYTVSGKSPQLVGVLSDVVVPGAVSCMDIGEEFTKYPLPADAIEPHFEDTFSDVSFFHRSLLERMYQDGREVKSARWTKFLPELRRMAEERLAKNDGYKKFLQNVRKSTSIDFFDSAETVDYQLDEAWRVLKDLVQLSSSEQQTARSH